MWLCANSSIQISGSPLRATISGPSQMLVEKGPKNRNIWAFWNFYTYYRRQWLVFVLNSGSKLYFNLLAYACAGFNEKERVKKTWIYTSTPPYIFMAQCLIS
jgi:hypothetical protein